MGKLLAIGYFLEGLQDRDFPAPQELMQSQIDPRVIDYLDSGISYVKYRGYSWCRIGCGITSEEMGRADLTDGKWVWPEGLVHYVRDHSVALPPQFCHDAIQNSKKSRPVDGMEYDYDLWKTWCSNYRDSEFIHKLESACLEYENIVSREKDRVVSKFGYSDQLCHRTGCKKRALNRVRLCEECIPKGLIAASLPRVEMEMLDELLKELNGNC